MKKFISTIMMSMMLVAVGSVMSVTANAQTRSCQMKSHYKTNGHDNGLHKGWYKNKKRGNREYSNANYANRYDENGYSDYDDGRPNVYQRHRKAMNIGIGTGAGAILGALIGGKKGALIGAAAGAGGGYIVTKVQKPQNHRRY